MFDSQQTVPLTEIQRLRTHVSEVAAALQSQQEILRTRGMNLPPGALQNLENIDRELQNLEKRLTEEETELTQLRALADTSALINSSLDLDEVLHHAMDEVIQLTHAERGYMMLKNPKSGELELLVSRVAEGDSKSQGKFQGSNSIVNEVLSSGKPLLTENAYKDPRMQDNISVAHMVLRSVLCVPLIYKGQIKGALYVDNRLKSGVFSERELGVLEAFANQVAVAITNAQVFKDIQTSLVEITEIKELMTNVFESIASGIITTDGNELIQTYNPAASTILGRPANGALGQPLSGVLPDESRQYIQSVRERSRSQAFDTELQLPDAGRKILNMRVSPLKDRRKETQGVAVVVDDMTGQREREEQFDILKRYLPPSLVDNIERIAGLDMGGERRDLSCIFVDVRSISTFPPGLRPQEVMALLNEYLSVATDCINRVSGVIDKYMGTEVMVLFNTRLNEQPGDHALRAVQAALLMREGFLNLYKAQNIQPNPHYYRIGINSGWATTGNVGSHDRRDFTALGDTINVSHRLLENAGMGQIIISDSTLDYLRKLPGGLPKQMRFEERDPVTVKGRQQATGRYEVFQT
jgi:adenylate cyclase